MNDGSKNPSASNKTTTQTPVSATGNFPVDQNGNLVGSLTLSPTTAAELGFSCPPETATFVSVTYTMVLTDTTSGATISLSGTFSCTNPSAP